MGQAGNRQQGASPAAMQNRAAGFAMVAYPAAYGDSGVMTFIISHSGKIYQKDLGAKTSSLGAAMTEYNPGPDWKKVEE